MLKNYDFEEIEKLYKVINTILTGLETIKEILKSMENRIKHINHQRIHKD